jgi:maltose O-acetyltransferase
MLSFVKRTIGKFRAKKLESYLNRLVSSGLVLGEEVSILEPFFLDPSHVYLISIGNRCTFAPGVRLIAHDASIKRSLGFTKIGRVTIGDDCFIGAGATILCDVVIGANCIIGAGSVVTRSIPEGSVAAGCPARVICSTSDYIDECRQNAEAGRVFDRSYQIDTITKEKISEVRKFTESGASFLV